MRKKLLILPILLSLSLTGCDLFMQGESNTASEESRSGNSSSSQGGKESHSTSEKESTSSKESYTLEGKKLLLNPYGDYVQYEDANKSVNNLESEYKALTKKVKSEINGVLQSNYQKGLLDFFNIQNKIRIVLDVQKSELEKMNEDHNTGNTESFRKCNADIYIDGFVIHYEEVGIRQKGNLSRQNVLDGDNINLIHYKMSFEETFDDEYTKNPKQWTDQAAKAYRQDRKFFGIAKIDLRWNRNLDATYIREYYAYEMYRENGALSPRTNPVSLALKINGNIKELGVYLAVETINKSFIKRNFVSSAQGGDLYKLSWGSGEGATFNSSDSRLFGSNKLNKNGDWYSEQTYTYDLKTNKDTSNHSTIKNFISTLQNEHGNTIYQFMQTNSLYDQFITYLACSYLLGDPDDLRGNYNNSYVYFTPQTNQMVIIPIDHDRVLGATGNVGGGNPTGSHGARTLPLEKRTGYSENDSKLINVTLLSSNSTTIPNDYKNRIQSIINNNWMSMNKYNSYYNYARTNYSSMVNRSSGVKGYVPNFEISENTDLSGDNNLDVATYMSNKSEVFTNNK